MRLDRFRSEQRFRERIWDMKRTTLNAMTILAISLIFLLVGCGGSAESTDGGDPQEGGSIGSVVAFETEDLDGNKIRSEDLFAENKITMINMWGTYCPPCIEEMPDLQAISEEYADRGAAVVGLVVDVPVGDDSMLEDAETIISKTGVTFRNLRAWEGFDEQFPAPGTPTTFFFDSGGKMVAEPVVGGNVPQYLKTLDQLLK